MARHCGSGLASQCLLMTAGLSSRALCSDGSWDFTTPSPRVSTWRSLLVSTSWRQRAFSSSADRKCLTDLRFDRVQVRQQGALLAQQ